jgi:hypothetical protein
VELPQSKDVTTLLLEWGDGKSQALNELMPLVYSELRNRRGTPSRQPRWSTKRISNWWISGEPVSRIVNTSSL